MNNPIKPEKAAGRDQAAKRVLIIEDEAPLREAYALLMEQEGFNVSVAENGRAGLEKINDFRPDIVLLDLLMPVMNGMEFLKATTRRLGPKPRYKTLVLSNLSDPMSREEIRIYRVAGVAMKADLSPIKLVTLVKSLAYN